MNKIKKENWLETHSMLLIRCFCIICIAGLSWLYWIFKEPILGLPFSGLLVLLPLTFLPQRKNNKIG